MHKFNGIAPMASTPRDVLHKLHQIEQSAQFALAEIPAGLGQQHIKLIIGLAKYLATEVELCSRDSATS
jgi:hypothetical protein